MLNHTDEQIKPKRRSFLQMTRELLSPKIKATSTVVDDKVEVVSPLPSPVQLPHIEQLEPIGTDISSEIQFPKMNDDKVAIEETNEHYEPENTPNDDHHEERTVDHHPIVAEEEDQQNKKDHPKRSSLLLKFLFPKRTSEQDAAEDPPEEPVDAPNRPASPLGRRVSALLSHIPARKEKPGKLELLEDPEDGPEKRCGVATTA